MLFASLALVASGAMAQTRVTGVVVGSSDNQPVAGAAVKVTGTKTGIVTDMDGRFSLIVPQGAKELQVSYIGMKSATVKISKNMKITLEGDEHSLDEIMVVGYGTARKSAFTGSASTVDATQISSVQSASALKALTGAASGVMVTSYTGQPGTDPDIRIRGVGSLSASSKPLYVVDGVPFDGNISSINSSDIESMNVLKDAASAAIYGARGANGVVIITTKKGKKGDAKITVDAKWGVNNRAVPNYDVIDDTNTWMECYGRAMYNEGYAYYGDATKALAYVNNYISSTLGYQIYDTKGGDLFTSDLKINPNATLGYSDGEYYYKPDDWYDAMYNKNNLRQEYNVNVSGASDKMNYYASIGYLEDTGILNASSFKRYTGKLNADYQAKDWLKVGADFNYSFSKIASPDAQNDWGSSGNAFYIADNIAPIYPLYVRNADGSLMYDSMGIQVLDTGTNTNGSRSFSAGNPLISMNLDQYNQERSYVNAKGFALIDLPLNGLQFNANIDLSVADTRENNLYNPYYGTYASAGGATDVNHYRRLSTNQQYLLTYKNNFGEHNVDLLAGYETYHMKYQTLETSMQNLYLGNQAELGNAVEYPSAPTSNTKDYTTMGWLFRAQYNYAQKYFFSASYRRDASSHFADGHRWGNFGSVGAAWILSKENFMQSTSSWLDELKYKISYGIQGNDNLLYAGETLYYPYEDQYTLQNLNGVAVPVFSDYKGNKDITWETSYAFNTGFEFSLFKGRLKGSIEYYNRTTTDMLYYKPVPVSYGYDSYPINSGKMYNRGVEIDLSGTVYKNKNVSVDLNANLTTVKNKVTEYPETNKGSMRIIEEGGSIYESYLRSYAGVWHGDANEYTLAEGFEPELGDALYFSDPDNGDYTVTDYSNSKLAHQGSTLADVFGGFGLNVRAYGFDLSAQFAYQLGGRIYDHKYQGMMSSNGYSGHAWHKDILGAWSESNPTSNIPRLDTGVSDEQDTSNRFLVSSDYLSLANITIGYTLPEKWLKPLGIGSIRVYMAGDNLWLLTARKGLDPRRALSMGVTTLSNGYSDTYAAMKTISGGITISF